MASRRWPKHMMIAALMLILLGVIYDQVEESRDDRRFPQVGKSFDIGGRSLNIYCSRQEVGFESMNPLYSVRNACMGSTDAARRAGIQQATRAIALRNAGTIAKVSASCG
jgi:hypothetical protein